MRTIAGPATSGAVITAHAAPEPVVVPAVPVGTPIVFVHGTRTSSAIWHAQVAAAAEQGHASVAIDLPGHGARVGERFTWEGAIAAIDEAVAGCTAPPLLVGLSLGGYASLAYAGRHQDRLAGVVLSGCSTQTSGKPLRQWGRVSAWALRTVRRGGGTWHVVTDMLTSLHGYSPLTDLRRLLVPVWLVNGARDPLRIEERRYVRARPGTVLTVVPKAGHDVNTHAPAAFNRVLLGALASLR